MVEELFSQLALKCYRNGLDFNYCANSYGVYIYEIENKKCSAITHGYIKNWSLESPVNALTRMHKEVDRYVKKFEVMTG